MGILKDYFSFSKRERTGVIILVIVIVIVFVMPDFLPVPQKITDTGSFDELRKQLDSLKEKEPGTANEHYSGQRETDFSEHYTSSGTHQATKLFHFDPNTLPGEGWKKLGLNDRTIQTIQKYISKGGSFRRAEDLAKIYGLQKSLYERLLPFVRIQEKSRLSTDNRRLWTVEEEHREVPDKSLGHTNPGYFNGRPAFIDVNEADTTMLIALPGIGSKLANRILRFREKLGGFYSVEQLGEVYGLPDSVFQKIKPLLLCVNPDLQRININTSDLSILKSHPYIKPDVANAIVNYRQQHGEYQNIEELKKIEIISPELFQRIQPYLATQ